MRFSFDKFVLIPSNDYFSILFIEKIRFLILHLFKDNFKYLEPYLGLIKDQLRIIFLWKSTKRGNPFNFKSSVANSTFNPRRSPIHGKGGIVATSQPLATTPSLEILAKGGNTADDASAAFNETEPA